MSSPVQLSDLPSASSPLSPTGLMLYRSGLTDFQATLSQVQAILINALSTLANPPQPTDFMMVQPASGAATGQVYFGQVGFTAGTRTWFYQATAPMFWSSVGVGDTILAVSGGSQAYNVAGGNTGGTWQQGDVSGIPGTGLSIPQIPDHVHKGNLSNSSTAGNTPRVATVGTTIPALTGSAQSADGSQIASGVPHNHGSVWRPLASVGIICQKMS